MTSLYVGPKMYRYKFVVFR